MFRLSMAILLLGTFAHAADMPPAAAPFADAYYRVKIISPQDGAASVESMFNSMASAHCRYIDKLGEDRRGLRVLFLCRR